MTWNPDGIAAWLYKITGFETDNPPGPIAIAKRLFGEDGIAEVINLDREGPASLSPALQQALEPPPPVDSPAYQIWVNARLPEEKYIFDVAHELAEWALDEEDYREDDRESYANAIAAAIIAPRPAYQTMLQVFGFDLDLLATAFCVTQSFIALRHGEVTGIAIALIRETDIWKRGEEIEWPEDRELRRLSKSEPGIDWVMWYRLTDRRRRTVVVVTLLAG